MNEYIYIYIIRILMYVIIGNKYKVKIENKMRKINLDGGVSKGFFKEVIFRLI